MPNDMPMPPDRYRALLRSRRDRGQPDPLIDVERRDPAASTTDLARAILDEAGGRRLESGELLLLAEEAALADLAEAAARIELAVTPRAADDPLLVELARPRLLAARVDEALGWQPPLAEYLKLLESALRAGEHVHQTMLVGHVEAWPDRVEHLVRLRDAFDPVRKAGGTLTMAVVLVDLDDLPGEPARLRAVARAARPADASVEVSTARAIARLALGHGVVVASPDSADR